MTPDWIALALGFSAGAGTTALYLAGLAAGMRLALRGPHPVPLLVLSAALRIALLLAVGYWVSLTGLQAALGFALGFLVVRTAVVAGVRLGPGWRA